MRIESVRFGVRSSKTIRKSGQKGVISTDIEKAILKQSNKGVSIQAYGEKLIKSANNFEKINKNERKRKLKQNANEVEDEDEIFEQEDEEFYVQVIPDKNQEKRQDSDSDNENEETKDQDGEESQDEEIDASNEPVKAILDQLATLQKQYVGVNFDDIAEGDQIKIKELQRELNKFNPKLMKIEGNANKQIRAFTLEKLSGFMSTHEFQRKYLQTGEKQGKYMLKPGKKNDGNQNQSKKQEKRNQMKNQIKSDQVDYW
jgi:hypothetical protein